MSDSEEVVVYNRRDGDCMKTAMDVCRARCQERRAECKIRFRTVEESMGSVVRPDGALSEIYEKLSSIENRMNQLPAWPLLLAAFAAMGAVVLSSFAYTKAVNDEVRQQSAIIVTKQDMSTLTQDIREIRQYINSHQDRFEGKK